MFSPQIPRFPQDGLTQGPPDPAAIWSNLEFMNETERAAQPQDHALCMSPAYLSRLALGELRCHHLQARQLGGDCARTNLRTALSIFVVLS